MKGFLHSQSRILSGSKCALFAVWLGAWPGLSFAERETPKRDFTEGHWRNDQNGQTEMHAPASDSEAMLRGILIPVLGGVLVLTSLKVLRSRTGKKTAP
jgi:hypothetical protein